MGQFKNQCRLLEKNQEAKDDANVASTSRGGDMVIYSFESKDESSVLNFEASFNATSQKEFFKNYIPGIIGKVYLGNEKPCKIVGNGEVKINNDNLVEENKKIHLKSMFNDKKNLIEHSDQLHYDVCCSLRSIFRCF